MASKGKELVNKLLALPEKEVLRIQVPEGKEMAAVKTAIYIAKKAMGVEVYATSKKDILTVSREDNKKSIESFNFLPPATIEEIEKEKRVSSMSEKDIEIAEAREIWKIKKADIECNPDLSEREKLSQINEITSELTIVFDKWHGIENKIRQAKAFMKKPGGKIELLDDEIDESIPPSDEDINALHEEMRRIK